MGPGCGRRQYTRSAWILNSLSTRAPPWPDQQGFAQVLKMHGGPWLEAYCFDGVKRMCHICGKMGRKVRIAVGDIVLISLRGFQVRLQAASS